MGFWSSAISALAIEFGLVGLAVVWVVMHPPEDMPHVVPLLMSMVAPSPNPLPVVPTPVKVSHVQSKPVPQALHEPVASEAKISEEPAPPSLTKPTAFSAPAQASPPVPAASPSPPVPSVDPAIAYNLKLAAAVQTAFVVPGPAAALGFKGRARLEFHLRDGVVSNAKIIQASGLGAVDRAALKAVEVAQFPAPPSSLLGKEGVYQIWVACY